LNFIASEGNTNEDTELNDKCGVISSGKIKFLGASTRYSGESFNAINHIT